MYTITVSLINRETSNTTYKYINLPREFSHVILTNVYMCHQQPMQKRLENCAPDAAKIVTGDFIHYDLNKALPGYQQQMYTTRGDRMLDLFFCNTKDACMHVCPCDTAGSLSPWFGKFLTAIESPRATRTASDITQVDKGCVGRPKEVFWLYWLVSVHRHNKWTKDAWDALKGCFDCTDWSVFTDTTSDANELADTMCEYINVCFESIVPSKTVKIYPNNKPWVTKHIKTFWIERKTFL